MNIVIAIAFQMVRELRHRSMLGVVGVYAGLMTLTALWLIQLGPGIESRLMVDIGLALMEWCGFAGIIMSLAIMSYEEIELRTVWLVLVKPVRRWEYVAGKAAGMGLMALSFVVLMAAYLGFLCVVMGVPLDGLWIAIVTSILLKLFLALTAALAISVVTSSLASQIMLSGAVVLLGHVSHHLKAVMIDTPGWLSRSALWTVYYLLPNFHHLNMKEGLSVPGAITASILSDVLHMVMYTMSYTVLGIVAAVAMFSRKEFR